MLFSILHIKSTICNFLCMFIPHIFHPKNYSMKTLDNINFKNERALIRVDFNVPLDKTTYQVSDDTRIKAALPTIQKVLKDGGSAILMSHLGRPKGTKDDKYSLKHIIPTLEKLLGKKVLFAEDCISSTAFEMSSSLSPGDVLLLENLRFYAEEEKGDKIFAEKLSQHGSFYINDAFGTAHRAHASTTIVADFFSDDKKCFGYLMAQEVKNLRKILYHPDKPFTAIIGGAKVSDKIKVLEALIGIADNIIIGGAMAFTFIKAKGGTVGKSLCENEYIHIAMNFLSQIENKNISSAVKNTKVYLPVDVVCAREFKDTSDKIIVDIYSIPDEYMGLDIGPKSVSIFKEVLKNSKSILWNGPMGVFEFSNFEEGTKQIAMAVAEISKNNHVFSVVGGGDSVAAINKYHLDKYIGFVSTGGGAMLEFIENGSLPGIDAIEKISHATK